MINHWQKVSSCEFEEYKALSQSFFSQTIYRLLKSVIRNYNKKFVYSYAWAKTSISNYQPLSFLTKCFILYIMLTCVVSREYSEYYDNTLIPVIHNFGCSIGKNIYQAVKAFSQNAYNFLRFFNVLWKPANIYKVEKN